MNQAPFSTPYLEDLAEQAERFMVMAYERRGGSRILHNDSWAITLSAHAQEIALRRPGVSPDVPPLARCFGLLTACRYWGEGPGLLDMRTVLKEFREWTGPDYLPLQLTLAANLPDGDSNLRREVADVLHDAQLAQRLLSGAEGAELSWLEERYVDHTGEGKPRLEAYQDYLDQLRHNGFRDASLRRKYQHTHSAVILELQKMIDRLQRKNKKTGSTRKVEDGSLEDLEKGPTRQAAQTYFRSVFRNHIHLKRIADQKAAIMVSVNALLIGVILTYTSYRDWWREQPELLVPMVIFICCGLASLVYALFAARPLDRKREGEVQLSYHGSFSKIDEDEYWELTRDMLQDPDSLYQTLTKELYGMGHTVSRKYQLLRISYDVFLIGLLTTTVVLAGMILT